MIEQTNISKTTVNVSSEYGHLNAVLLHKPGIEIERMTPSNAAEALYSDILSKHIVDKEYASFAGVFEKWCKVYYVEDVLAQLMDNDDVRQYLMAQSCRLDECEFLADELMSHDSRRLAVELIEGVPYHGDTDPKHFKEARFTLKPLYNLFFTRDASSSLYDEVLINSMSFRVRQRETLIYRAIFEFFFGARIFCGQDVNPDIHTEGGDVQVASADTLCIGQGIRTNPKGIEYLAQTFARERDHFNILVQELPMKPESFIHLDMVFTFLSQHQCMAFEPMLRKEGLFADKDTTLIRIDNGQISYHRVGNMLEGLQRLGWEIEPILCGGTDPWVQLREQWHSGANFFALGEGKVMGYRRNTHTVDALDKAGFSVLNAEDIIANRVSMNDYDRFVAVFPGSELPRAGGGARCMTMPIWRD